MSADVLDFNAKVRELVHEEIRRIVADAIADDEILHVGPAALRLSREYGACGLTPEDIADELALAAVSAGVPMELGRSRRRDATG